MTRAVRRLCIVTTHPIQYAAPWFRVLSSDPEIDLHVIFYRRLSPQQQGAGFGRSFVWDVPLESGYAMTSLDVDSKLTSLPKLLWRLVRTLRSARPDAVLVTGWNEVGLVAAYPLVRLLGLPVIARGDSNALKVRGTLTRLFHQCLVRFFSAVITVGRSNSEFYRSCGIPLHKTFEGAHFVESPRMLAMADASRAQRELLRAELGFSEEEFVFVFSGKMSPYKRPFMVVEAAALLLARGAPVNLLFVGSGELMHPLKERCLTLGVRAVFLGFLNQSELWKGYVPSDALILPSDNRETWGLVVNEAMLFGLPVIVSDQVGCGPDLVVDGETGYRFSGESEALAFAMEKLLDDRLNARRMGEQGRALVLARYSMANATQSLKLALSLVAP